MRRFLSWSKRIVFFFDEGRFGLQPNLGRAWSLRGARKKSLVKPGYRNFYLYSSVSPLTGDSFILFLPWVNTEIMNLYLEKLSAAYPDKKLLLIMDQAGWHKSKALQIPNNIEFYSLPAYSPELNPVEKLWLWLRRQVCRNRYFDSESKLMDALIKALRSLSKENYKTLCRCQYLFHFN